MVRISHKLTGNDFAARRTGVHWQVVADGLVDAQQLLQVLSSQLQPPTPPPPALGDAPRQLQGLPAPPPLGLPVAVQQGGAALPA